MHFAYLNKILINKITIIIFFLIVFKIPIITINYFILLTILITILISEITFKKKIKFYYFILIIILVIFSYSFDTKRIIERHGIFLPNNLNENIYLESDQKKFKLLISEFKKNYSKNDLECKNNHSSHCWIDIKKNEVYSRSFDNVILKQENISRNINQINHSNLSNFRLGDINNRKYNWFEMPDFWSDKNVGNKIKRINSPYIINYSFLDPKYSKSKICWKGKAIIEDQNKITTNLKLECVKVGDNFNITFLNLGNDLEVNLIKSMDLKIFELIIEISKYFSFFLFLYLIIRKINLFNIINYNTLLIFSTGVLIYTINKRMEFSTGYQPLQGGMDGLVNEGYAREIYQNFLNLNFYEVFKGGENIFYFMPGLRYFLALEKLIFGDNHFAVYLIILFLPIVFYVFLIKLNFSNKISISIILFFIIIKIPHLGFSYNQYIKGGLTIYSETPAIFCFFLTMILLIKKKFFYSGLICSAMVFLRPNYFPAHFVIILFNFIISFKYKDQNNMKFIYGSLFIILIPFHNLFYGNDYVLFVKGFGQFNMLMTPSDYLNVFNSDGIYQKFISQLKNLLSTGQNNILVYAVNGIFLTNLFCYLVINRKSIIKLDLNINLLMAFIALAQLLPLLFFNNTGRYGVFAWLLVTILNLITIRDYFIKKNPIVKENNI